MKLPLLQNSAGQKSVSFTMLVIGFLAVTLWLLLSIFESLLGFQTREFSGSEAMSYLSPLFLLYFGRKWMDAKATGDTLDRDASMENAALNRDAGVENSGMDIDIIVDESGMDTSVVKNKSRRPKSSK